MFLEHSFVVIFEATCTYVNETECQSSRRRVKATIKSYKMFMWRSFYDNVAIILLVRYRHNILVD